MNPEFRPDPNEDAVSQACPRGRAVYMAGRRWPLFTEVTVPDIVVRNLAWLRKRTLPLDTFKKKTVLLKFCQVFRNHFRPDALPDPPRLCHARRTSREQP